MSEIDVNENDANETMPDESAPAAPAPTGWDPFAELEAWARRLGSRPTRWPSMASGFDGVDFTPLADVEESETAWTIEVEVPGVKKKDIQVETKGRTIVIAGERKEKERTGIVHQRRRVTGSFRYEVTLSGDFEPTAIAAKVVDGELTITVPKAEAGQAHKVKVG